MMCGGSCAGGHSHRKAHHVLVALNGGVTVSLDDGVDKAVYARLPEECAIHAGGHLARRIQC